MASDVQNGKTPRNVFYAARRLMKRRLLFKNLRWNLVAALHGNKRVQLFPRNRFVEQKDLRAHHSDVIARLVRWTILKLVKELFFRYARAFAFRIGKLDENDRIGRPVLALRDRITSFRIARFLAWRKNAFGID